MHAHAPRESAESASTPEGAEVNHLAKTNPPAAPAPAQKQPAQPPKRK